MAESKELKSLLMKVKEESENFSLNLNILKTKIMTSSPIISQQIDGETVETVRDFISGMVRTPPADARDIRDAGSIPELRRSLEGGFGNPLQYSFLENPHGQRSLVG